MKGRLFVLVLSIVAVLPALLWAETDSETVSLAGVPSLVVTADVTTASVVAIDSGLVASKRAVLVLMEVNGQDVYLLVRFQRATNGTFLDLVGAESLAALDARLDALDLSAAVPAHPSPARDAVDDEPYLSAGGT